ncbi:MAG: DUF6438 domain-containing protein [Actinomycetota bacterium]
MTRRSFTAFLTIALFVSTEAAAAVAQKRSSPPEAAEITEISLSYAGSHFAASSGFTLILRKDGTAAFEGAKNSSREGDFVGTFDKKEFAKLAKFIVAQEFFALENDYIENIQDGGMTTTRVCFAGGEKTVRNNSWRKSQSADNRLPDIENAVSAIDSRLLIRWKKLKK